MQDVQVAQHVAPQGEQNLLYEVRCLRFAEVRLGHQDGFSGTDRQEVKDACGMTASIWPALCFFVTWGFFCSAHTNISLQYQRPVDDLNCRPVCCTSFNRSSLETAHNRGV